MIDTENAAKKIIKLLDGRGGFDGWWSEVAEEDKRDILDEIADIVEETHDP